MAETLKEELMRADIIRRVDGETDWISPAKFIPKSCGSKVRLVTDFCRLNKTIKRPVHPFPSAHDIIRTVKPSSTLFTKVNAVHGYFQVPLNEKSQLLTTFILPDGKYCYKAAPMGLSSSGDELCQRTDEVLRGLSFLSKIVDNGLIQANNADELYSHLREFMLRCRQHGINISKKFVALLIGVAAPFIAAQLGIDEQLINKLV